jgi:hypothetical protein
MSARIALAEPPAPQLSIVEASAELRALRAGFVGLSGERRCMLNERQREAVDVVLDALGRALRGGA